MKLKSSLILSAIAASMLVTPVLYAAQSPAEILNACKSEAEANEVSFEDMPKYLKQCMTDQGVTAADADKLLQEKAAPAASGEEKG